MSPIATLGLLTAFLLLAVLTRRIAFRPAPRRRPRSRLRGAFYAFAAITILLAYALYGEVTAAARLAGYIQPYPGITGVMWMPRLPGDDAWWVFQTPDPAASVLGFYRDPPRLGTWTLRSDKDGVLVLQRAGRCLRISAGQAGRGGQTTIIYTLHDDC